MAEHSTYNEFHEYLKKLAHLGNIGGLSHWDQEVNMPEGGASFRAHQLAYLSSLTHEYATSGELERYVEKLKGDQSLNSIQQRNVKEVERDLEKDKKLPSEFISRLSQTTSEAYQAWMKARQEEDFSIFAPKMQEIVDLNLEKAEYYGYKDHPYDALLDDFEPGLTLKEVDSTLNKAKDALIKLLDKIRDQKQPDKQILSRKYNSEEQIQLSRQVAKELGFDFQKGRLDVSEHPFTISFNPNDVRITTRFKENDLAEGLWSTIHETGHALYEQGLKEENYGLPSGEAISLGIHESQARLWENHVGKSFSFVKGYLPIFKQYFPETLGDMDEVGFYQALNTVEPGFIRTAADEITYHLHILIRFELEKDLIEKKINVKDLPEAWNEKYKSYLGLEVPSLKMGVLQDVHWSHGAIGYFPTYSLGSFYSAQFFRKAEQTIGNLQEKIAERDFQPLLNWLRENIHQHGKVYNSKELCEAITGESLNFDYFEQYAWDKYSCIYELS